MIKTLGDMQNEAEPDESTVLVLMCSHNRKQLTLRALTKLDNQDLGERVNVFVVLFDDGSTDGTSVAVNQLFPAVSVLAGDGTAFWSKSMARAQAFGLRAATPTHLLWLNDDVDLTDDALSRLLRQAAHTNQRSVIVGAVADRESGLVTYSGYLKAGGRPLQLRRVNPTSESRPIDSFNGNVVLVPRKVFEVVGTVAPEYAHGYGDIDYGYRVVAEGFDSVLAAGYFGTCSRNKPADTWRDAELSVVKRITQLFGTKGMPIGSHARFIRAHGGKLWALNVVATYAKALAYIVGSFAIHRLRRSIVRSDAVKNHQGNVKKCEEAKHADI